MESHSNDSRELQTICISVSSPIRPTTCQLFKKPKTFLPTHGSGTGGLKIFFFVKCQLGRFMSCSPTSTSLLYSMKWTMKKSGHVPQNIHREAFGLDHQHLLMAKSIPTIVLKFLTSIFSRCEKTNIFLFYFPGILEYSEYLEFF